MMCLAIEIHSKLSFLLIMNKKAKFDLVNFNPANLNHSRFLTAEKNTTYFFNCVTEMFPYSIVKIKGCLFFLITNTNTHSFIIRLR